MMMNGVTNIKVVFKHSMLKGLGTVYPEIQICLTPKIVIKFVSTKFQVWHPCTSIFFNKTILKKYNYGQNEIEHLYC